MRNIPYSSLKFRLSFTFILILCLGYFTDLKPPPQHSKLSVMLSMTPSGLIQNLISNNQTEITPIYSMPVQRQGFQLNTGLWLTYFLIVSLFVFGFYFEKRERR